MSDFVAGAGQAVPALSGYDPLRVRAAVRGAAEVAAFFGKPEREVAENMAWHAGYLAGAQESAAFSAGAADAEQRIMDWLSARGLQGERLAYRISRCEHRDSAGRKSIVQP